MSKELIERLRSKWRKPENKSPEMCEAADRIEQLEAEVERLKSEAEMREAGKRSNIRLAMELAASQLREQQLREFSLDQWWYKELLQIAEESGVVHLSLDAKRAILGVIPNLIGQIHSNTNTTALEATIQKAGEYMREMIITNLLQRGALDDGDYLIAIRTIPTITLDDLK